MRALFAALLLLPACSTEAGSEDRRPDLLVVTIDTLRADHLGLYGYDRPTSPNLDRFAERAVVFEQAHAQTSWTLASLASMMTSAWVGELGLRDFRSRMDASVTTLAEVLAVEGWETGAVGTHLVFLEKYGLRQGIDDFDDELVLSDYTASHRAITSEKVSDKGLAWIEAREGSERPWFLWLHYFDPHIPYVRHRSLDRQFGDGPVDRYDGEIAYTDLHLGRVLERVAERERETVVLVTSDHGEEFGDHGGKEHGHTLYQELIRVPLVLGAPGLEPARITERVRLVDVMPTLLDLLGVAEPVRPEGMVGASLVPLLRGEMRAPLPSLSELRLRRRTEADSLVRGRWKLIVPHATGVPELYDLDSDPREIRDLAGRRPELVASLRAELEALTAGAWEERAERETELEPEEVEALQNLGYLGDE